jgi:hypothetical protein
MAELRSSSAARTKDAMGAIVVAAGATVMFLAVAVLLIECVEWLTSEEWPGLTLADGLSLFGVEHDAPESDRQRSVDVLLAIPLTLALFAGGFATMLAGTGIVDREAERRVASELRSCSVFEGICLLISDDVSALQFLRLVVLGRRLRIAGALAAGGLASAFLLYMLGASPAS